MCLLSLLSEQENNIIKTVKAEPYVSCILFFLYAPPLLVRGITGKQKQVKKYYLIRPYSYIYTLSPCAQTERAQVCSLFE
uniref:Uncharacterized protein n=1 Tax=Solanum tuberosum TaxID=4113 RepID=M1AUW0_SOLTU